MVMLTICSTTGMGEATKRTFSGVIFAWLASSPSGISQSEALKATAAIITSCLYRSQLTRPGVFENRLNLRQRRHLSSRSIVTHCWGACGT